MKPIPDWFAWLDAAIANEPTDSEARRAASASWLWPTCACGQLCQTIPRDQHGEPYDEILSDLGGDFAVSVNNRRWPEAKETMLKIEARTTELLTQPK